MTGNGIAAQLAKDLDPEDLRMVLEVFRQDVNRLVVGLDTAVSAGDVEMFHRTCHALAGAAGAVGAERLEQASRVAMTRADLTPARLPAVRDELRALGAVALDDAAGFLAGLPPG